MASYYVILHLIFFINVISVSTFFAPKKNLSVNKDVDLDGGQQVWGIFLLSARRFILNNERRHD